MIPSRRKTALLMTSAAIGALLLTMPAYAGPVLPTGGNVASGQASISSGANSVTVNQSSRNAIINWNGFSIGQGGAAQFNNGSGATLNRVTGPLPSSIDGTLSATGSVYLVNPSGVVVGKTGRVSTGGDFIASTQDISDADFNTGKKQFSGNSTGAVINYGQVGSLGGDVTLIARQVQNSGTITAPKGTVGLAAGTQVLLSDSTLNGGKLLVQAGGAGDAVTTEGAIKAADVELKTNGGNIFALAGNTNGIVKASGITNGDGHIYFDAGDTGSVTVAGTVKANSANGAGGTVVVQGQNVTLKSTAAVDASGTTGGTILIGGDQQGGANPATKLVSQTVRTAQNTNVDAGATIKADGAKGAGGNVVVWSNDHTSYAGAISATGDGGNGGNAEVSSHGVLDFSGTANLLSTGGAAGTLLLDPYDVTIGGSDTNTGNSGGTFTPTGTSNISVATLEAALAGGNVVVNTTGAGTDAGNITVAEAINWTNSSVLSLTATNHIVINAPISASQGGLALSAATTGTSTIAALTPTITTGADGSVNVGTFILQQGSWVQNSATLPAFSATNFQIIGGSSTPAYFGRFGGGAGTVANPWLITDVYGLQGMAGGQSNGTSNMTVMGPANMTYALASNIDASGTLSWNPSGGTTTGFIPIALGGVTATGFKGNFDGMGHTITGLYINNSTTATDVGLFGGDSGAAASFIRNVGLIAPNITGSHVGVSTAASTPDGVGALVGAVISGAMITNDFVQGGSVTSGGNAGGLVGLLQNGLIAQSFAADAVSSSLSATTADVGGLVGYVNGVPVTASFATGNVTAGGNAGGLVGLLNGSGSISNSYATGNVSGGQAGGLVGTGSTGSPTITNSYYSLGTVSAPGNEGGGIIGGGSSGTISIVGSYWDIDKNPGLPAAPGVVPVSLTNSQGLTEQQLQSPTDGVTNFVGWDFTNTWAMVADPTDGNAKYPQLFGVTVLKATPQDAVTAVGTAPNLVATYTGATSVAGTKNITTPAPLVTTGAALSSNSDTTSPAGTYTITLDPSQPMMANGHAYLVVATALTSQLTIQTALPVSYVISGVGNPTYGTTATTDFGTAVLTDETANTVLNGINYTIGLFDSSGNPVTWSSVGLIPAGRYTEQVISLSGPGSSLYAVDPNVSHSTVGHITINQAQLTITADSTINASKIYDGTTSVNVTGAGTVSGIVAGSGDAPQLVLTANYGGTNAADVGTGKSINGSYVLTGPGAGNYVLASSGFTYGGTDGAITPVTLTITSAGTVVERQYDGTNAATAATGGQLGGVVSADASNPSAVSLTLGGLTFDGPNAGSHNVTGTYSLSGSKVALGDYIIAPGDLNFGGTGIIDPRQLTIATQGTVNDKTYNGSNAATVNTVGTLGNVVSGDESLVSLGLGGLTFSDANAGTNKSVTGTYSLMANDNGNYVLADAAQVFSGHATITPLLLDITNLGSAENKVYDATTNASLGGSQYGNLVAGDQLTLMLAGGFADPNVGTGKTVRGNVSLSGSSAGNYQLSGPVTFSGSANITPAPLTIATAGTVADKVYDGGTAATVATNGALGGVVGSDAVTLTLGDLTFADANAGAGKSVSGMYSVGGAGAGNYQLTDSTTFTGTASITPATLTIAAAGTIANKVYDGTTAATATNNGALAGLIGSDTVDLALNDISFVDKNVGAGKSVSGTYVLSGADAANYQLASGAFTGAADITPATLTYAANTATRAAGRPDPAFSGTVTGFVNNETQANATTGSLVFAADADGSSPPGSYAINGSGLDADYGNYVFVQAPGNASALTITGTPGLPPQVVDAIQTTPNVVEPTPQIGVGPNNSTAFTGSNPVAGAGNGPGAAIGSNGPDNGNSTNDVFPDNRNFGPWIVFASTH